MYLNRNDDASNHIECFHCDCMDLQHTVRFSYWEDTVDTNINGPVIYAELMVELQSTWWQEWYKRVWTAIKFVFKKGDYYYAGVSITKRSDVVRMRDTLNAVLNKWKEGQEEKINE